MTRELATIELRTFRSHQAQTFALGELSTFVGPNGAGKTNILEAVWLLATSRSFRTRKESEMIAWEAPGSLVRGGEFEVTLAREPLFHKALRIRGVTHRPMDYLGELRAVLFTPDSLTIVTGSPAERRRFLDILLAQRDHALAGQLAHYRQVLAQRNALLRLVALGNALPSELGPWDEQLVRLGTTITAARQAITQALAGPTQNHYRTMSGQADAQLSLTYHPTGGTEPDTFREHIERVRRRELALQATLVGPHRDELEMSLGGHRAAIHASRGELRSILVALKWSECDLLRHEGKNPLLLLDDLFSELDEAHRAALGELLKTTQTLCTTTELANLPRALQASTTVHQLARRADGA